MRLSFALSFFALLFLAVTGTTPSLAAGDVPSSEARDPEWREQRQNAASFVYDWLNALDTGDYKAAARSYRVDADRNESEKILRAIRAETGKCTAREFGGAVVFAVATDESEHKVRVIYQTDCSRKNITETMEVLLWPKAPVVLRYTVQERQ